MATQAEIHVGDPVLIRMGSKPIRGIVVEARGKVGKEGPRIFRVAWTPSHSEEQLEFEIAEGEIAPARG